MTDDRRPLPPTGPPDGPRGALPADTGRGPQRKGPVLIELGPAGKPIPERGAPARPAGPDGSPNAAPDGLQTGPLGPDPRAGAGRPGVPDPGDGDRVRRDARADVRTDHGPSPADAPPISDDPGGPPSGRTMQTVVQIAAARPSRAVRLFVQAGVALFTFLLSVAALRFISDLMAQYPLLGWIGAALFALFTLAALALGVREYAAFARLARIDHINRAAVGALATADLGAARAVAGQVAALYADRPELAWGRARVLERQAEAFDAHAVIALTEAELLAPLDAAARSEVEAAARTVATVTAIVPLAFADVAAAFAANLRMIRRLAEIYGGRAGAVGGWRLARTVMTHLVATGAVAVGDDLIHTVAGGGALAKVSRRFGEGVVNGALTARVGIAAIEVCRPLPFTALERPRVTTLLGRALRGLFGQSDR